jgi:signal transduction histidine kinase
MSKVHELAHEIRTPLAAISSNNDLLEDAFRKLLQALSANESGETRDLVKIVEESLRINRLACERLEGLVRSLRDEPQKTDIHHTIENALALLTHELKDRITVTKDFGKVARVETRGDQLHQVFLNLLINAAQAIPGPGSIRITTRQEGAMVRISISDDGPGIPEEIRDKIFERGFTTKSGCSGMGLGLWICRKIVEDHGGRIEVESKPGDGTTFTTVLPASYEADKEGR